MTRGYQLASTFFSKASINVTKAAIKEASARSPWEEKHHSIVWRGTTSSDVSGDRKRTVHAAEESVATGMLPHGKVNVHFSEKFFELQPAGPNQQQSATNFSSHMDIGDMIHARGILSIDGVGNEWTLPWKLMSNSVTLLVESSRVWQWYYPRLRPWQHYVPIRNDLSDFVERVRYVLDPANDAALKRIAEASTALVSELHIDEEVDTFRTQLERTFQCTG